MASIGRLHLVTDHRLGPRVPEFVSAAVTGGVRTVQIRVDATSGDSEALTVAGEVLDICRRHSATCLVNDRVDVALACGADGVHVGAGDLPVAVARRLLGDRALVGATARDPAMARRAQDDGADYVGVGPFRHTTTKNGLPAPLGLAGVGAVAAAVQIPVIAIGGIVVTDLPALLSAGVFGVAVVSALSRAQDPAGVLAALLAALPTPVTGTGMDTGTGAGAGTWPEKTVVRQEIAWTSR